MAKWLSGKDASWQDVHKFEVDVEEKAREKLAGRRGVRPDSRDRKAMSSGACRLHHRDN